MGVWQVVRRALASTLRVWPIVLVLWAVNLVLAGVAVQPLSGALGKAMDSSLLAKDMEGFVSGPLAVDIAQVLTAAAPGAGRTLGISGIVFALIHVIVLGGVLGRLDASARRGDGFTAFGGFMADCGRFAWRSIRLTLLGLGLTAVALVFLVLTRKLMRFGMEDVLYESPKLWLELVFGLIALTTLVAVRAMVDAARADMFLEERRTMRRAMAEGIRQVVRHPIPSLVGYGVTGGVLVLLMAVVLGTRLWMPEHGWIGVMLAALLGQLAMILRTSSLVATSAAALIARGEPEYPEHWAVRTVRQTTWGSAKEEG